MLALRRAPDVPAKGGKDKHPALCDNAHADLVTPLALAPKALREEGFNQSLLAPYLAQIGEFRAWNSLQP